MDEGGTEPSPTMVCYSRPTKHAIGGEGGGQLHIEELTWLILFPWSIAFISQILFHAFLELLQFGKYDNQLAITIHMNNPMGSIGCVLRPHKFNQ